MNEKNLQILVILSFYQGKYQLATFDIGFNDKCTLPQVCVYSEVREAVKQFFFFLLFSSKSHQ